MDIFRELVNVLIEKKYTIACAESCTGGMFTSKIVDIPDASKVLNASVVTYSNEAKVKYANVSEETLEKFGAVSEEVAAEMAKGIAEAENAEVGIAFSGIAGPSGGTEDKPVGTVCIGYYICGKVQTETLHLKGERLKVRQASVEEAAKKLLYFLKLI